MRKYQQAASDLMMLMTTFPASALSDCHTSQEYRNWMADRLEEVAKAIRTGPDRARTALPAPVSYASSDPEGHRQALTDARAELRRLDKPLPIVDDRPKEDW
jgi:hypothetical protein